MKKTKGLWLVFHILFLVVFNTVFFLLKGTDNLPSVWISYVAIHLAYIIAWMLPFLRMHSPSIFGLSRIMILHAYFWIALLVGIIFIIFEPQNWKVAFIPQLLIFFIFAIPTLLSMIGGEYAKEGKPMLDELANQAKQTDYVKMAKTKLEILLRTATDMELKMQIDDVANMLSNLTASPEKNTQRLLDYTTKFASAVGSKNLESIQNAKTELMNYMQNN